MRLVDIDARECWACAHHCKNGGCSVWCENGEAFELRADLKEAAIVEAVPVVHGEWIRKKPDEEVMNAFHEMGIGKGMSAKSIYWTCSECGGWGTPTHKFCSNCGAKMT